MGRKFSECNEESINTSSINEEQESESLKKTKIDLIEENGITTSEDHVKQKKKKKKKEMYRVDSDICFGTPSLSASNLAALESKDPEPTVKMKLPTIIEPSDSKPLTQEGSPELKTGSLKKKKKKLGRQTAESSLANLPAADNAVSPKKSFEESPISKTFEESSDWDSPLKPGETEIVLPNKSYKGSLKLKEAAQTEEVLSPSIAPVESFTAAFLK